ncbi:MAG: sigma factor-like helix-turn-helix DNA-binding protein [bacterium]|nr:sigma factor-like helix-turn-helix DNA-binding protein [bacterium]
MAKTIAFKPKQVVKKLLTVIPERARNVIEGRFGLSDGKKMTLEAIGKKYSITRERVRQIENAALEIIRKSEVFKQSQESFSDLKDVLVSLGGVVDEESLLTHISTDKIIQNNINFLLVLGHLFEKHKEDEHFKNRWVVDKNIAERVHQSLKKLFENISDDDLISEAEMIASFLDHLKDISEQYKNEEILKRWLFLSKKIKRNLMGEWGVSTSPNVSARGVRDYAFLVLRKQGNPMHFTDVAKTISDVFGKRAHIATTHNELIKDKRFVLVGRGLYALSQWGYEGGVVRDVIGKILKKEGPLTKKEIVDRVLKERQVKENTIMVNLQNSNYFARDEKGKYRVTA